MKTRFIMLIIFSFILSGICSAQSVDRLPRSCISATPGNNAFLTMNSSLISPHAKYYLIMQSDGNLVLYKGSGPNDNQGVIWHTNTYTGKETPSFLAIQDDGNLVVYRGSAGQYGNHVWQSETYGPKGNYCLALQDDGNLVIYMGTSCPCDIQHPVWSIQTGKIKK